VNNKKTAADKAASRLEIPEDRSDPIRLILARLRQRQLIGDDEHAEALRSLKDIVDGHVHAIVEHACSKQLGHTRILVSPALGGHATLTLSLQKVMDMRMAIDRVKAEQRAIGAKDVAENKLKNGVVELVFARYEVSGK